MYFNLHFGGQLISSNVLEIFIAGVERAPWPDEIWGFKMNKIGAVLARNVYLTASLVAMAGSAMSKSSPWKSRELQRTSGSHFSSISETFDIALKKIKN